jgi:hypothetical protein
MRMRWRRSNVGLLGLVPILASSLVTAGDGVNHWKWRQPGGQRPPYTLAHIATLIDASEREIRAGGTIVVKQPDVWGQDRMTAFRRDFDLRIRGELDRFQPVVSAQVARTDNAAVAAAATVRASVTPAGMSSAAPAELPLTQFELPPAAPFVPLKDRFSGLGPQAGSLGIEPSVLLDERKSFLDHGYELLRVNLGDDTSDAAGYGLYLFRLPVSIDPAGPTFKGWGGSLTVTVKHDFGNRFAAETFRSLVVNDLVDLLAPIVGELIRSDGWRGRLKEFEEAAFRYRQSNFAPAQKDRMVCCVQHLKLPISPMRLWKGYYPIASADLTNVFLVESFYRIAAEVQDRLHSDAPRGSEIRALLRQELEVAYDLMLGFDGRRGPLADIGLIEGIVHQIQARHFEGRPGDPPTCLILPGDRTANANPLLVAYHLLMARLPGNTEQRAMGALCWAVAIDAGLLNRQLRNDMWRLGGTRSFVCPENLHELFFYPPVPDPAAEGAFAAYVRSRWPVIAMTLEPAADQQNIADAYQRNRALQLSLTGAFAAGKIGARALESQMRQARYDTNSLTLNRTITAFAHGADTFGWRFYPRYQSPRDEPSTVAALLGVLSGFDPLKSARLEPGQRELTVTVIAPSFLRSVRIETAGNWFKLTDPSVQRLDTAVMLDQGRRVAELRQELAYAAGAAAHRSDDVARLATRIDQLERQLALQTYVLGLPYDPTLGGFELFTQGAISLVPELVGYEGVEGIDPTRPTDLLLMGKHFSLSHTRVVVSGVGIPQEEVEFFSRRAVRVRIPAGVSPTATLATTASATPAYELYLVTPGGSSNRLVIPCVAPVTLPFSQPEGSEFGLRVKPSISALAPAMGDDRSAASPPRLQPPPPRDEASPRASYVAPAKPAPTPRPEMDPSAPTQPSKGEVPIPRPRGN